MEQMTMFDTLDGRMSNQPRLISPAELAIICQMQRTARGWSQDTLAELTGLTVRTVQRVEAGQPSNPETRRALARVFGADDIDTFNKPHAHLTPEEFEAQERERKEDFERKYVTLDVAPMTGRGIARLGEGVHAACVELSDTLAARKDVEDVFAELKNYVRDFMDVADEVGAGDRLTMGDEMERMVGDLRSPGLLHRGRQAFPLLAMGARRQAHDDDGSLPVHRASRKGAGGHRNPTRCTRVPVALNARSPHRCRQGLRVFPSAMPMAEGILDCCAESSRVRRPIPLRLCLRRWLGPRTACTTTPHM